MTNCSLMKVKSIRGAFGNTFDQHLAIIGLKTNFWPFYEWPLKTSFTVVIHYLFVCWS